MQTIEVAPKNITFEKVFIDLAGGDINKVYNDFTESMDKDLDNCSDDNVFKIYLKSHSH